MASEILHVFKQLFRATQYAVPQNDIEQEDSSTAPLADSVDREQSLRNPYWENDTGASTQGPVLGNLSETYVRLLLSDLKENTEFIKCATSLLRFVLLENVAMPYVGRLFVRKRAMNESSDM